VTGAVTQTAQVGATAPVTETGAVAQTAPVPQTAAVSDRGVPRSETAAVTQTAPVTGTGVSASTNDLFAGLPQIEGFLRTPYTLEDHLVPMLEPFEQLVYRRLYRLSHGFQRNSSEWADCVVGIPTVAAKTRISEKSVQRALRGLEEKGLVRRKGIVPGTAGATYSVRAPVLVTAPVPRTRAVPQTAPVGGTDMKRHVKEIDKAVIYKIREFAVQLREMHRSDAAFTRTDLREAVKQACAEAGVPYTDALVEEALGKLNL
jgi:hypothetical protein